MKYARKPAQTFTPGDDQPETPCTRDVAARLEVKAATGTYPPSPFDVLFDGGSQADLELARRKVNEMCDACPIKPTCHAEHADEDWLTALNEQPKARRKTGPLDPEVLAKRRASRDKTIAAKRAARAGWLRELIAAGADLSTACEQLGMKRDALYSWCKYSGHGDLYATLSDREKRGRAA